MSSASSPWSDTTAALAAILTRAGVYRFGIARAEHVDPRHIQAYTRFIEQGRHASMQYLERYTDLRTDPRTLLAGTNSVISCAIPYYSPAPAPRLAIARYARGADYHTILRDRLESSARSIREICGGETRVCIDTAPILERYWAVRAGIGFIGRNRQLIVPGAGSYFFLAEILTTAQLPASEPCTQSCGDCGRCLKACPTGALGPDGTFDARRCLSYLTIEHRGEFAPDTDLHGTFYGCDRCADACPHNARPVATTIPPLLPDPAIAALTPRAIAALTPESYATIFRHSPMKRAKLAGLLRNLRQIATPPELL